MAWYGTTLRPRLACCANFVGWSCFPSGVKMMHVGYTRIDSCWHEIKIPTFPFISTSIGMDSKNRAFISANWGVTQEVLMVDTGEEGSTLSFESTSRILFPVLLGVRCSVYPWKSYRFYHDLRALFEILIVTCSNISGWPSRRCLVRWASLPKSAWQILQLT
jgi:hypothetical protein